MDEPNTPVIAAIEIEADEIDEVSEALAVHGIISEQRHEQILEEVNQCREKLEVLLTKEATQESPTLTLILERLMQMQIELADLRKSTNQFTSDSNQSNTLPSELVILPITETEEVIPNPDEIRAEELTDAPSDGSEPPKPEPKKKKYKIL